MPCIVTSIHDPIALAATCRCFGLRRPEEGCLQQTDQEASGWIVRLSGLHAPLVFNTLTGLVAYHPRDNAFGPYARIMRFVYRYYDVRAKLRRQKQRPVVGKPVARTVCSAALLGAVA
jgi:hypothetical protein